MHSSVFYSIRMYLYIVLCHFVQMAFIPTMPEDMLATAKKVLGYTWYSKLNNQSAFCESHYFEVLTQFKSFQQCNVLSYFVSRLNLVVCMRF